MEMKPLALYKKNPKCNLARIIKNNDPNNLDDVIIWRNKTFCPARKL